MSIKFSWPNGGRWTAIFITNICTRLVIGSENVLFFHSSESSTGSQFSCKATQSEHGKLSGGCKQNMLFDQTPIRYGSRKWQKQGNRATSYKDTNVSSALRTHILKRELEQLLKELGMTKEDGIHFRAASGLQNVDSIQVSQDKIKIKLELRSYLLWGH